MSVTTTQVGTNTVQLTLSGETSSTNFITALDTAITSNGWSQVDISNPYNRVYSAVNADGSTLKYIGISIDPGCLQIRTTSYESWNATTHVGTNEVWTWNRAGVMSYNFNYCDVLIMINPRWLILQTFVRGQVSCWAGVVELAREAPEDTIGAGYPCWCWITSAAAMTQLPNAGNITTTAVIPCVSFPRTRGGLTGISASSGTSLQTPYTRFGAAAILGQPFASLTSYVTYAWDTTKKIIHSVRPVVGTTEQHGRMFGLKLTYNIGSPYNRVSVPVDSNYGYSASGTNTSHWVLGGVPALTIGPGLIGATVNYPQGSVTTTTVNLGSGAVINAVEPVGLYYYIATATGVFKIDNSSTTPTSLGVLSGTSGKIYNSITYDNDQYVYAAGPDGVYRIDTLNSDTVTFLATNANGVTTLLWDGTYLWAGNRTAATTGHLFQINVTSFTVAATINLGAVSTQPGGICTDYQGNMYALTNTGTLYKIVISSSTVSVLQASMNGPFIASGLYYNGVQLVACGLASSVIYYNKLLSLSGTIVTAISYTGYNSYQTNTGAMQIGKHGIYDYYAGNNYVYNGIIFTTDLSGLTSGIVNTSQVGQNSSWTSFQSDGNRAYGSTGTLLSLWTNMFRPDDNATTYGRFLLPQ